jgi:glucose/arabinose dehydrogenase
MRSDLGATFGRRVQPLATSGQETLSQEASSPHDEFLTCGTGPQPVLPAPSKRLIPTINIADAKGWPAGAKPIPASGLAVNAYTSGLDHPRWLYVLPNGDVLVAETNAPKDVASRAGFLRRRCGVQVPQLPAPIGLFYCVTPMATASRRRGRFSYRDSIRRLAWH